MTRSRASRGGRKTALMSRETVVRRAVYLHERVPKRLTAEVRDRINKKFRIKLAKEKGVKVSDIISGETRTDLPPNLISNKKSFLETLKYNLFTRHVVMIEISEVGDTILSRGSFSSG